MISREDQLIRKGLIFSGVSTLYREVQNAHCPRQENGFTNHIGAVLFSKQFVLGFSQKNY
jgi:hypothetical protein